MALTITVTDPASSGAVTVTVAGSSGSVSVYYAGFPGLPGALAWVLGGTRSGDGNVSVTVPQAGSYFFYAVNSALVSPVVFQVITDGLTSVHYRCLLAVQQRVQGLSLTGINNSNVEVKLVPRSWDVVDTNRLPGIMIVPMGKEGQPGILNGRDDIEYPVVVALVDSQNESNTANLARNLLNRQRVFRALRNQRLAGVPEVILTKVEPDFVFNSDQYLKNLWYSAFLVKPRSREIRG